MRKIKYGYAAAHTEKELISDRFFQINNCGFYVPEKKSLNTPFVEKRPSRKDHYMAYFSEIGGYFEYEGVLYELNRGDLVYIAPQTPLLIGTKQNSNHFWIHFTGKDANEILESVGINKTGIYHVGYSQELIDCFSDISFRLSANTIVASFQCIGIFFQALSYIFERINPSYSNLNLNHSQKIYPAIKQMNLAYHENHSMIYYANLCDMSLSSFKHMFTDLTHISPLAYLTSIRISNAKSLLISTDMTIAEIAQSVGYDDPQYFSRVFKKFVGETPSKFQKQNS